MKLLPKKISLILISAMLVLAGCAKKPIRPDPGSTILGPQTGSSLNPTDVPMDGMGLVDPSAMGLVSRGDGVIETDDMIRGLLQPVYFDFNESAIRASERAKLQAAYDYLVQNPQHRILLEGHCDWRGTAEYNQGLGDRRAGTAKQFLTTLGAATSRVETLSKGDLEAVENASADQMANDRRVEIVILKR